jgi:hypothetical protein
MKIILNILGLILIVFIFFVIYKTVDYRENGEDKTSIEVVGEITKDVETDLKNGYNYKVQDTNNIRFFEYIGNISRQVKDEFDKGFKKD